MATCSICEQPAPADDKIVVSEIGEQWSPNTEPAKVAAKDTTTKLGSKAWATRTITGIQIPNVPQAVPVENDKNAANANTAAGNHIAENPPVVTSDSTKSGV